MTQAPHEEPSFSSSDIDAEAYVALLRREQQIDALQRTLGWRLLAHYGPYKRRFVMPAWRRLQRMFAQWMRGGAPARRAYDEWAQFSERVHAAIPDDALDAEAHAHVSVIMLADASSRPHVDHAVAAMLAQRHQAWELMLTWIGDTDGLRAVASTWSTGASDPRIRVDPQPHASQADAVNAAVARAEGGIVALLPPRAILAPDALRVVTRAFRATTCDVLYGDEDEQDDVGHRGAPQFKPGWSPDLLLARTYWSNAVFYRRSTLTKLLPLAPELEGAHGYDLALRVTEQRATVTHVPRILAHVSRVLVSAEVSPSAVSRDAGRRALVAALARRGVAAAVHAHGPTSYRVERAILAPARVSIIVPTRDGLAMLRRCLAAVERTNHPDVEVLIVDNDSREEATLAYLARCRHTVVRAPGPFNFSRLNNLAVARATGRYLLFLNDDTEPCGPDWLRALEEHAQRPEVGAVGAKFLYPDGRIQHAGIAVGIGGLAGHPFRFRREAPDEIRDVSAVTAACLMMRREVFDAVGGFDERLPVNSNDVDLCLRLRARGLLVVYTPHATLYHYESQTRGARAQPDDAWLMTRRWREVLRADPYYSPNLDLLEETGDPDLSKPDGLVSLYEGVAAAAGGLRIEGGGNVGQRFFAPGADLTAIVLRARVTGPDPERALRLVIREAPDRSEALRTVERSVVGRSDEERWFCFEPMAESADRFWYVRIDVAPGHVATLERRAVASDVMGPCFVDEAPSHGTMVFSLFARAPYRTTMTP
jgi:GT2 family glycosyltransferase